MQILARRMQKKKIERNATRFMEDVNCLKEMRVVDGKCVVGFGEDDKCLQKMYIC